MKKLRKLLALVLVVCMVCAVSVTAFATDNPTPYGPACGNCETGKLLQTTKYTRWTRTGYNELCTHDYAFGDDIELQRTKTITEKCNVCASTFITTEEEYKMECHGYN